MNRRYNINEYSVLKSFMYSHHQSCGWEYCVLIYNAWKFSSTLKSAGILLNGEFDDYLIVECPTLDKAIVLCNSLPDSLPRTSIWESGMVVYDSKDNREKQNG